MGPIKPPTREEYQVLFVASAVFFLVLGAGCIVAGMRAPPEKHDLAQLAMGYGAASMGLGVIIALAFWLGRQLTKAPDPL